MAPRPSYHLLFFTSRRSGPARRMESLLAQLAHRERARLQVSAVDADASPALASHFDVTEVPTLVLLDGNAAIGRLEGRATAPDVDALVTDHLPARKPAGNLAA